MQLQWEYHGPSMGQIKKWIGYIIDHQAGRRYDLVVISQLEPGCFLVALINETMIDYEYDTLMNAKRQGRILINGFIQRMLQISMESLSIIIR